VQHTERYTSDEGVEHFPASGAAMSMGIGESGDDDGTQPRELGTLFRSRRVSPKMEISTAFAQPLRNSCRGSKWTRFSLPLPTIIPQYGDNRCCFPLLYPSWLHPCLKDSSLPRRRHPIHYTPIIIPLLSLYHLHLPLLVRTRELS